MLDGRVYPYRMGPVNMRLVEQARSIFAELGYTVEETAPNFEPNARGKWST